MTGASSGLEEAARRIRAGELIVYPAESVYGIGGVLDEGPLTALRELKGRSSGGFVVLLPTARDAEPLLPQVGCALGRAFWPGPLTLVADDPHDRFHPLAKAADGSVALRVPGRRATLALLEEVGRPLTSTSANRPGDPPATTATAAREAARAMGHTLFALDDGPLPGGAASTIVRLGDRGPVVLREGPIATRRIADASRASI